ncbi:MAG: hypothetical protein AB8G99_12935 [Planctomycetaceae bacterium]
MQHNHKSLDLGEALTQQTDLYDRAINIAETIDTPASSAMQLDELQQVLDQIAAFGTSAEQMQALQENERPAIRQQASLLQTRIEKLLGLIQNAEDRFRSAKSQLLPQVKQEVNARKMLDAYGGQR